MVEGSCGHDVVNTTNTLRNREDARVQHDRVFRHDKGVAWSVAISFIALAELPENLMECKCVPRFHQICMPPSRSYREFSRCIALYIGVWQESGTGASTITND